jgi:hypothetical protein
VDAVTASRETQANSGSVGFQSTLGTTSALTWRDRWVHVMARLGVRRGERRVAPGLYRLGNPGPESPVFVTANYALSFDALRSSLLGWDGFILVLDTQGINVWCAAGKGTFGTEELVRRIETAQLKGVVTHRRLILPQLGAPGVAAHEVVRRAGFRVEYGPVRASDLPEYLRSGKATAEMRLVRFDLCDRLVLIPVEGVHVVLPTLAGAALAFLAGGTAAALAVAVAVLAGITLFPILLPWIPTADFSSKGFLLGFLLMLPFAAAAWLGPPAPAGWQNVAGSLVYLLTLPPVTAFLALNFTGSTTLTSRSGVRAEIYAYIPWMAGLFGVGVMLFVVLLLARVLGA